MHVHIQNRKRIEVYSYDKIQNVRISVAHCVTIVSLPCTQSIYMYVDAYKMHTKCYTYMHNIMLMHTKHTV